MGATAGIAAAAIARREREIVDTFRTARATTPDAARDPDELRIHRRVAFRRLVQRAVLREVDGGRYYLDEPTWLAFVRFKRRLAVVVAAAVIVAGASVLLLGAFVLGHSAK